MRIIGFSDISIGHVLCYICGVLQEWEPGTSWNFIGAPRPKQGFMYISSGAVSIEYPNARTVCQRQSALPSARLRIPDSL